MPPDRPCRVKDRPLDDVSDAHRVLQAFYRMATAALAAVSSTRPERAQPLPDFTRGRPNSLQARARVSDTKVGMSNSPIPVVYVAGSGHTGSTLLALVLDSHPEVACIGESAIKPQILKRGAGGGPGVLLRHGGRRMPVLDVRVRPLVRAAGLEFGADDWTNDYRFHNVWRRKP